MLQDHVDESKTIDLVPPRLSGMLLVAIEVIGNMKR